MFHSIVHRFQETRWGLYQKLESDLHELRYLFWETTRRCNLNCLHCGSDCGRDDSLSGMPAELVVKVLSDIAGAWDARKIMLVVSGGEPLVRPDLFPILERAHAMGFRIGMVTNGWALTPAVATRLAGVGLESIVVSLDGPRAQHDWLRNRQGAFDRAVGALRNLVAVNIPIVEAITCVTPASLPHLEATYEIVRATGANYWRVFNIFPIGRARDNADLLLAPEHFRTLIDTLAGLRRRGEADGVKVNLSEEGYLGFDVEPKVRDGVYFCRAGVNIAGILADGTFAACPNLPAWMGQGHAASESFVDVWNDKYQIFRDRSWMKTGRCAECSHFDMCRGNSLHIWDPERREPAWCHYDMLHPGS
ncbi:MAG: radical SAM/SPASM domain-containing protein [Deltaproteobacteria bacterium HGW-Deltaproteobacteria-17]|nr:MAG: radical SAM/SPASM domain-containing protein [Deltaproteobacteria bacterium HGW-Deltaproteobacteria-17]